MSSQTAAIGIVPRLTAKQADYLDTVVRQGLITPAEAAEDIGGHVERKTTAWKVLERLEALALVQRTRSRGSRVVYFTATELGKRLASKDAADTATIVHLVPGDPDATALYERLNRADIPGATPLEKLLWLAGAARVQI